MKKVERALVQGTVTFRVTCNDLMGLVTPDIANRQRKLEDWLEDKAFKLIDDAYVEVEIDNVETVDITEATANELTDEVLSDDEWKRVFTESKKFL